jgi:type II secretory pathway predicted ATPase ExeA
VRFNKTDDSDEIMDSVGKNIIEKYTEEKIRSVLLAEDISENQHEIFSKLQYLADLNAEKTEEPIATIIMTGTSEYFQALAAVLPQIADRSEPIDVPRFGLKHSREFIGRRIAYAKGEIASFDIDDYSIHPFHEDAVNILANSSQGIPRDLRLLCRAAVSITADALFRKEGKGEITYEIAKVVSEYYQSFLSEV